MTKRFHFHCCALDWRCWMDMWTLGAPMRVQWGPNPLRYWDIPILTRIANWRNDKVWLDEVREGDK